MEEERRLFYVGITRAEDRLYLLRALRRGGAATAKETIPSRYLDEHPTRTAFRQVARREFLPLDQKHPGPILAAR